MSPMIPAKTLGTVDVAFQTAYSVSGSTASSTDNPASRVRHTARKTTDDSPKLKVIVADDEHIIADTLALILNGSGYEARPVYSGESAVEVVGSFEADVLISDVVMTGMTGVEAAIEIRTLRPSCKVLLFSGQAATADLLHDARLQGHSFEIIAKPVHPAELLARLRTQVIH